MKKPTIIIKVQQICPSLLKEIVAGLEEEGVLYEIIYETKGRDVRELAREGAQQSALGVGIGINQEEAVLQVDKMKTTPLFIATKGYRIFGQNAARYVKGKYFLVEEG